MTRICEHGRPLNASQLPEGGWNGGVGFCQCCLSHFGYIDSGSWTKDHVSHTHTDQHLCRACGGKTIHVSHRMGEEAVVTTTNS